MALPTVASSVSSGLGAYPTIYFDRVAVDTLQSNLAMYDGIEKKIMPDRSGVVLQMFDHSKMSANTTAVTEGQPDLAGQSVTQNTRQITLSEFADYISISSKVDRTQLIDQGEANAALLGYRGALSVDTLITNTVETARAADSATQIDLGSGVYLSASKIRQAVFSLGAVDVKPKDNGLYFGVTHNLSAFDLCNDNAAGSFMDLQKYSKDMSGGLAPKSSRIGVVSGCEIVTSNAVKTTSNYISTSTGYHTIVFGKTAIYGASLGKTALGQDNFSVMSKNFRDGNSLDPAGLIAAAQVYHFFFGSAKRPGSTNGFRVIRAVASIT